MKKYTLTESHRKKLKPWSDKWIANALSTKQMDDAEKEIVRENVKKLYLAANLVPPPDHRIVFVPSPIMARFVAGFASAIWYMRKNPINLAATIAATRAATIAATRAATRAATSDATYAATESATYDATDAATASATYDATDAATASATDAATYAATYAATRDATRDATYAATASNKNWYSIDIDSYMRISAKLNLNKFGLQCAYKACNLLNGGNQWSGWVSFLSFFRYIAKLKIDYSKFDCYEKLCEHSGPRYMHEKFCIVSDRPKTLLINSNNQPHNFNGPFCEWRDGSKLYSFNGIRVPEYLALKKNEDFTKEDIINEKNADIRREIVRKIGINRTIELLKPEILDTKLITLKKGQKLNYELLAVDIGDKRKRPYLRMENPSAKGVYHIEGVSPECKTVEQALEYRNGTKELPDFIS